MRTRFSCPGLLDFLRKKNQKYGRSMASDAIALNFLKELDSTGCSMQVCRDYVVNSNSWLLAISKGFSEGLPLFKLTFVLKVKKDFNKNQYFMCLILKSEC